MEGDRFPNSPLLSLLFPKIDPTENVPVVLARLCPSFVICPVPTWRKKARLPPTWHFTFLVQCPRALVRASSRGRTPERQSQKDQMQSCCLSPSEIFVARSPLSLIHPSVCPSPYHSSIYASIIYLSTYSLSSLSLSSIYLATYLSSICLSIHLSAIYLSSKRSNWRILGDRRECSHVNALHAVGLPKSLLWYWMCYFSYSSF